MASITKRGDSYRVLIRKKGYPPVSESFKRKSDAEKWARETETQMDRRIYIVDTKQTVAEVFKRYRDEVSPAKPGGRWERLRIDLLLRTAAFMRPTVSQVSYQDLQKWRDVRLTQVGPASVQREFSLISSVFNHAIREWHIAMRDNPCSKVRRPPKVKARNRRVEKDELERIWTFFGVEVKCLRYYAPWMFEFAIETGLRLGELSKLRWRDVHLDERWIYVLPGKNGDDRTVPLTDNAIALLATLRMSARKEERVFPVQPNAIGTEFREACKKLGIVDLHFHDSRHEACSRLAKIYTVMELAKIIGHRDLKSLMVYYNPTAKELAAKLGAVQSTAAHPQQTTEACDQGDSVEAAEAQENATHTVAPCSEKG